MTIQESAGGLVLAPDAGVLIPGTGGLRKLRWLAEGRGRRGGVRMIYYHLVRRDCILLLMVFAKNEQDDLTLTQRTALRRIVEEELL